MKQASRRSFTKFFSAGTVLGATLLLCLTAMLAAAPAAFSAPSRDPYIVVLKDDVAHPANVAHRHEANRGAEVGHIYGVALKGYSADLTPGEVKAIRQDPNVDYVEHDGPIHPLSQVTGAQIKRVYADQNPQLDIDGVDDARVNVDIAILDTGVSEHPDLNIAGRTNCVGGKGACVDGTGTDASGHGTHVAGDAAAIDNGIGVVGTAPGARIWSVKVMADAGSVTNAYMDETFSGEQVDAPSLMSDAIAGINWVTAHSSTIEVANMSFDCGTETGGCAHTALAQAIATSVNSGVVWIAAAGTGAGEVGPGDDGETVYPAVLPDVIAVSAMADYDGLPGQLSSPNACVTEQGFYQLDDRLWVESNDGPEIDITAPGACIYSTWNNGSYAILSGTSMAAGLVAGAAADIAAQYNPSNRADVEKVRAALLGSGNFNWKDKDLLGLPNDSVQEPLLDQHTTPVISPAPPAPTAFMGAAGNITESTATLNGIVNLNGPSGYYRFECGVAGSGAYPMISPTTFVAANSGNVNVSSTYTGLAFGTSYICRLWASSIGGQINSGTASFKTRFAQQPNAGYYYGDSDSVNMFFATAGGALALKYNDYGPGGGWKVTQLPGSTVVGPISAVHRSNGDVFAFYRSTDSKIHFTWLNHQTNNWEASAAMTGPATGPPSAVERNNGDIHAFYRGTDGGIHDLWLGNGSSTWNDQWLGGDPLGDPSATTRADNGDIHVFYRHVNGNINVLWLSGSTWQDAFLAAGAAGDPKALYRPDADLSTSAFYKGTDGKLHDVWHDPSGWHDVALGGTPAGNAAPIYSTKTGDIHVFYRSTTSYLRDMQLKSQTNTWEDKQVAGAGLMTGTPSPVNRTLNGDLHVFYMRSNGSLYDAVFDGTSWVDTSLESGAAIDSDSDEVFDTEDWCPTRAGVATNHGCPPEAQQTNAGYYYSDLDSVNTFFAQTSGALALKYNDYGLGGAWKLAQFAGTAVVGPISAIHRSNGDVLAFYRSTDSKIHITWLNHLNSKWETTGALTALAAGPPSAVERNNGDMHAFYRATDGSIRDLWLSHSINSSWIDQGLTTTGVAAGEPSVGTRTDNGEVHVFYRRTGGAIYDLWLTGNTWQEASRGGSAAGDPKALYRPDADLSISSFYRGTDGKIHDLWRDAGGWHDVALGGTPAGNAAPIYSTKTGNIHVFYRSTTGYLRDMQLNSQTNIWEDTQIGGASLMKGTPSPVNRTKNGDLHVFYVRSNGSLYDAVYNGTAWTDTMLESGAAVPTD